MSDTDDTVVNEAADSVDVEFQSDNPFDEPKDVAEAVAETTTEPTSEEQTVEEKPEASEEPSTEEETPAEAPEEGESTEDEAEEEKSESELKGMTRAERKEYFENQKTEQSKAVNEAVDASYQPQDVSELQNEYMERGYTEGEALILARGDVAEQKALIAEAKGEIVELNANLRVDSMEAQSKFDWMNPDKKDAYDKDLHQLTAELYGQMITTDPRTGQIIEAKMTPMELAQLIDKARNSGSAKASLKAQKAAEQQMASVAPTTSSAPQPKLSGEDAAAKRLEDALNNAR